MKFLDFFKRKPKVGGVVNYLNLDDWWLNDLNDDDRAMILNGYRPLGSGGDSIIEGVVLSTSQSQIHFLIGLFGHMQKPEQQAVADKILKKAESLVASCTNHLDIHFLYNAKVQRRYKERELADDGLELECQACLEQISHSANAARAFKQAYSGALPAHVGFKQLAIVMEKQKRYLDTIELCEKAQAEGWAGDWESRIARCKSKLTPAG